MSGIGLWLPSINIVEFDILVDATLSLVDPAVSVLLSYGLAYSFVQFYFGLGSHGRSCWTD